MAPPYPTPDAHASSPAAPTRVACIVVNWNNPGDTIACLRALDQQTSTGLAVYLVDNGSTDDSILQLDTYLQGRPPDKPLCMTLVPSGANLGFAAGNNVGIRAASHFRPEFFWLLNNDTLPPPDTLTRLLATADANATSGIVGSVLFYAHDPHRVQAWGGGHITPSTAYATHFTSPHTFGHDDYLTFASVLLRTGMLQDIGLLDERFFMYYEDVELCLRAQRAGWHLAVAPDTAILHKEGGSSTGHRRSSTLERAITVSGLLLIQTHGRHRRLGMCFYLAVRIANRLFHGRWREASDVFAGALRFLHAARQP